MKIYIFDEMFFIPEESKEAALEKYQEACYNLWESEDAQPESFREADESIVQDILKEFDYMALDYNKWVTYSPATPLVRMFEATEEGFEHNDLKCKYFIKLTDDECDGAYCFKLFIETYKLENGEWEYYCGENNVLIATNDNKDICGEYIIYACCFSVLI